MKAAKLIANWIAKEYEKYGDNKTVALISKYLTPSVAEAILKFLLQKGLHQVSTYQFHHHEKNISEEQIHH